MNAVTLEKLEFYEIINKIKENCISDKARSEAGK